MLRSSTDRRNNFQKNKISLSVGDSRLRNIFVFLKVPKIIIDRSIFRKRSKVNPLDSLCKHRQDISFWKEFWWLSCGHLEKCWPNFDFRCFLEIWVTKSVLKIFWGDQQKARRLKSSEVSAHLLQPLLNSNSQAALRLILLKEAYARTLRYSLPCLIKLISSDWYYYFETVQKKQFIIVPKNKQTSK
jgi:hypothetical protein